MRPVVFGLELFDEITEVLNGVELVVLDDIRSDDEEDVVGLALLISKVSLKEEIEDGTDRALTLVKKVGAGVGDTSAGP